MPAKQTCFCMTCQKCKNREYMRKRYRLKTYGQWGDPKADMEAVIAHIKWLRSERFGYEALHRATGISRTTLHRIATGGNKWVTHETANKILSVGLDGALRRKPHGTARRLQALVAIGYTTYYLADRLNTPQPRIWELYKKRNFVTREMADRVAALYDELHMTPGPSEVSKSRARAAGYVPPLAWDDIDDENEKPSGAIGWRTNTDPNSVDDTVVERILGGEWRLTCTRAEKEAVTAQWAEWGRPMLHLAQRTGWKTERYHKKDAA